MGTTDNDRFDEIKQEILRRAREAKACKEEYGRAYSAGDMAELMQVVKDNFAWCCNNKVLTADLFERYNEELAAHDIFCNVDVERGYLLAFGSSKVTAFGSSTVRACDSSYVASWGTMECKLSGNAIHRVMSTGEIRYASDALRFVKVEATEGSE